MKQHLCTDFKDTKEPRSSRRVLCFRPLAIDHRIGFMNMNENSVSQPEDFRHDRMSENSDDVQFDLDLDELHT